MQVAGSERPIRYIGYRDIPHGFLGVILFLVGFLDLLIVHLVLHLLKRPVKFTYEKESNNSIPFLDTLIVRKNPTARLNYWFTEKPPTRPVFKFRFSSPYSSQAGRSTHYIGQNEQCCYRRK